MTKGNGKLKAIQGGAPAQEQNEAGMSQEEAQAYVAELDKSRGATLSGLEAGVYRKLSTARGEAKELDSQLVAIRREIESLQQRAAAIERTVHMVNGKMSSAIELLLEAEGQRRAAAAPPAEVPHGEDGARG
jgi:polyhydroxyalkanoate synthesis regulator phasin